MTEERWEVMARVAKGLQMDDPINWPHYADEAAQLVEDRDRYREALEHIAARAKDEPPSGLRTWVIGYIIGTLMDRGGIA
jgi:hypothetical protein